MEPDALRQVGVLAQALGLDLEVELDAFEDAGVGLEADSRAGAARPFCAGSGSSSVSGHAAGVLLLVDLAGVLLALRLRVRDDLDPHLLGERVDDARADAVEAAGDLVAAAAELAAGVEDGHHRLDGGLAGLALDIDGDAAAVVA